MHYKKLFIETIRFHSNTRSINSLACIIKENGYVRARGHPLPRPLSRVATIDRAFL